MASDLWFGHSLSDKLVGSLFYTAHCTCTPPNNTRSCGPTDKPRLGRRMGSLTDWLTVGVWRILRGSHLRPLDKTIAAAAIARARAFVRWLVDTSASAARARATARAFVRRTKAPQQGRRPRSLACVRPFVCCWRAHDVSFRASPAAVFVTAWIWAYRTCCCCIRLHNQNTLVQTHTHTIQTKCNKVSRK